MKFTVFGFISSVLHSANVPIMTVDPSLVDVSAVEWITFYDGVVKLKYDLNKESDFVPFKDTFLSSHPDMEYIFGDKPWSYGNLCKNVVEKTVGGEKGLYYLKNICQYHPISAKPVLSITPEQFDSIKNDEDKICVASILDNCGSSVSFPLTNASDDVRKKLSAIRGTAQDSVPPKLICSTSDLKIKNKLLALFLADGMISKELDIDGKKLEGGHPFSTSCWFAQVLHAMQSDPELVPWLPKNIGGLIDKLVRMQKHQAFLIVEAKVSPDHYREIVQLDILSQLRRLSIGADIVIGVTSFLHAMLISVTKTDENHFELYMFNSGDGISHHSHFQRGRRTKYFPAKKFTGLTLAFFATSNLFHKIVELAIVSDTKHDPYDFPSEQVRSEFSILKSQQGGAKQPRTEEISKHLDEHYSTTALYENILELLSPFETKFSPKDRVAYRTTSGQRSGTCSFRCMLVYVSWNLSDFRLLKILMTRKLLAESVKLSINGKDPVMSRILSFALRNLTRSVMKYEKEQMKLGNKIDIEKLFPRKLIDDVLGKIQDLKPVIPVLKLEKAANGKLSVDNSVDIGMKEFQTQATEAWNVFKSLHDPSKVWDMPSKPECKDIFNKAFAKPTKDTFIEHALALGKLWGMCWESWVDDFDALSMIASIVINDWPLPGSDGDFISEVSTDDHFHALFGVLKAILYISAFVDPLPPQVHFCIFKITSIFHLAFARVQPDIMNVMMYMNPPDYLVADVPLLSQYFDLKQSLSNGKDLWYGKPDLDHPLRQYLSRVFNMSDLNDINHVMYNRPDATTASYLHYYWVTCMSILSTFNGGLRSSDLIQKIIDENDYHPNNIPVFKQPSTRGAEFIEPDFFPVEVKGVGEHWIIRSLEAKMKIVPDELQTFRDILRGGSDTWNSAQINPLRKYMNFLNGSEGLFDWSTSLYLGLRGILRNELKSLKLIADLKELLSKILTSRFDKWSMDQAHLSTCEVNKRILAKVRRTCAFIVLLNIIECISEKPCGSIINGLRPHLVELIESLSVREEYKQIMRITYVLSYSGRPINLDDARLIYKVQRDAPYIELFGGQAANNVEWAVRSVATRALRLHYAADTIKELIELPHCKSIQADCFPSIVADGHTYINLIDRNSMVKDSAGYSESVSVDDCFAKVSVSKPKDLKVSRCVKSTHSINGSDIDLVECIVQSGYKTKVVEISNGKVQVVSKDVEQILFLNEKTLMKKVGEDVFININGKSIYRLPEKQIHEEINVWVNPATDLVEIEYDNWSCWHQGGRFHFDSITLGPLEPLDKAGFDAETPLSNNVQFFAEGSNTVALITDYVDEEGRPLWFRLESGKWKYVNDEEWGVCLDQTFSHSSSLGRYLVLENGTDKKKVLLPIEQIIVKDNIDADSRFRFKKYEVWNQETYNFSKKCHAIPLENVMNLDGSYEWRLQPASRFEAILTLYHLAAGREYYQSGTLLRGLHMMEPLDGNELRIISWLIFSDLQLFNGEPEFFAIRAMAAFKVFSLNNLFLMFVRGAQDPHEYSPFCSHKELLNLWSHQCDQTILGDVVADYFSRRAKVPTYLRFDADTPFAITDFTIQKLWLDPLSKLVGYDYSFKKTAKIAELKYQEEKKPFMIDCIVMDNKVQFCGESSNFEFTPISYIYYNSILRKANSCVMSLLSQSKENDDVSLLRSLGLILGTSPQQLELRFLWALSFVKDDVKAAWKADILRSCCDKDPDAASICAAVLESIKSSILNLAPSSETMAEVDSPLGETYRDRVASKVVEKLETKEFSDFADNNHSISEIKKLLENKKKGEVTTIISAVLKSGPFTTEIDALKALEVHFESQSKTTLKEIHDLVEGPAKSYRSTLMHLAKGKTEVTFTELIHLYAGCDAQTYRYYFRGIEDIKDIQKIHDLATQLVLYQTNSQEVQRLMKAYGTGDDWKLELERFRSSKTTDRVIMAYEYYISSRLSPEQYTDIEKFVSQPNYVVQRIMSAGKTFILGTVLSALKSDGKDVPALVLPRALFTDEVANIATRTRKAFQKDGFSFTVSRNDVFFVEDRLEYILAMLKYAKATGQYVVMKPEDLLSMQNKLVEMQRDNADSGRLVEILHFFKTDVTAIFDEIDLTFKPTQELNYPLPDISPTDGKQLQVKTRAVADVISLCMDHSIASLKKIWENVPLSKADYQKDIRKLLAGPAASKILTGLENVQHVDVVRKFFESPPQKAPWAEFEAVKNLNLKRVYFEAVLITYKAIDEWIPTAWAENPNEHYGPSLKEGKLFCIPYSASKSPKFNSEYSNRWLAYVRTLRYYLVNALDHSTLTDLISWAQKAKEEEIKKLFVASFGQSASSIDSSDDKELKKVLAMAISLHGSFKELCKNEQQKSSENLLKVQSFVKLVMIWISDSVLPKIKFYSEQISIAALDIEYMVKAIQGYSGTIKSKVILPRAFSKAGNIKLDETIESTISQRLRSSGTRLVIVEDRLSLSQLLTSNKVISDLIEHEKNSGRPFNAVIDVGAYFKDYDNEQIVTGLLEHEPQVIYYSSDANQLMIKNKGADKKRIFNRKELASLQTQNRITYYDQQHTTGCDIPQDKLGFALLTVGVTTTSRDLYQAIMRMRKYLEQQVIHIILPQSVHHKMNEMGLLTGNLCTVDVVVRFCERNMEEILHKHNAVAIYRKIGSIQRSVVYDWILKGQPVDPEHLALWIRKSDTPIAELVKAVNEVQFGEALNESVRIIKAVNSDETFKTMRDSMDQLIQDEFEAKNFPKITLEKENDSEQQVESVAEAQIEMDSDRDLSEPAPGAGLTLTTITEAINYATPHFPEMKDFFLGAFRSESGFASVEHFLGNTLNVLIGRPKKYKLFDEHVYMSARFMAFMFGRYRAKPFNLLVLQKDHDLRLCVLEADEADGAKRMLEQTDRLFGGYEAWLVDLDGYILTSKNQESRIDSKVGDMNALKILLSQVYVLGGYVDRLTRALKPEFDIWLKDNRDYKLTFLTKAILTSDEAKMYQGKLVIKNQDLDDVLPFILIGNNVQDLDLVIDDIQKEDRIELLIEAAATERYVKQYCDERQETNFLNTNFTGMVIDRVIARVLYSTRFDTPLDSSILKLVRRLIRDYQYATKIVGLATRMAGKCDSYGRDSDQWLSDFFDAACRAYTYLNGYVYLNQCKKLREEYMSVIKENRQSFTETGKFIVPKS